LPVDQQCGHGSALAASGVNHPRLGAAFRDCFHLPEVADAHDRIGDVWIVPIARAGRLVRHESNRRDRAGGAVRCLLRFVQSSSDR
jgi:hypothetical protein